MKFEDSIVGQRAYGFAMVVVPLAKKLREEHREYDLARQLLRAGTSIGEPLKTPFTDSSYSSNWSISNNFI